MRIAIGLAFISVTVILTASLFGILPNRRAAVIDGRKKLCEVLSVSASIHARDHEFKRMKAALRAAVDRNEDMLSAAVRLHDGNTVVEIGPDLTNDHPIGVLYPNDAFAYNSEVERANVVEHGLDGEDDKEASCEDVKP